MKKIISLICIFTLVSMQSAVFASVKVPANTSIFVTPNESVTSKDMTVDTINASIVDDVIVNGVTVFQSGGKVTLHIGEIEKARCWGKPGKLVIANGYAYDVNGQKHKIIITKNYYGEERAWTKTAGVVSIFFLWPLALFGFVHGGQATVSASTKIETNLSSSFTFN